MVTFIDLFSKKSDFYFSEIIETFQSIDNQHNKKSAKVCTPRFFGLKSLFCLMITV